eukprot:GHVN01085292.1.p1 GENE.GHVN01085292.1~~GHVN01085292.1.p1  ORF type:complete len:419 (+),score=128.13 GHVN01085292.1:100-1356(+)
MLARRWDPSQAVDFPRAAHIIPDKVPTAAVGSLFVGSLSHAMDPQWLQDNRIGLVVTACEAERSWARNQRMLYLQMGVNHIHHHVEDVPGQLLDWRRLSLEDIHGFLTDGLNVLVHCSRGVSRSVTVVIGYLIVYERIPADEALEKIRVVRPIANPNQGFWHQLCVLSEAMTGKRMRRRGEEVVSEVMATDTVGQVEGEVEDDQPVPGDHPPKTSVFAAVNPMRLFRRKSPPPNRTNSTQPNSPRSLKPSEPRSASSQPGQRSQPHSSSPHSGPSPHSPYSNYPVEPKRRSPSIHGRGGPPPTSPYHSTYPPHSTHPPHSTYPSHSTYPPRSSHTRSLSTQPTPACRGEDQVLNNRSTIRDLSSPHSNLHRHPQYYAPDPPVDTSHYSPPPHSNHYHPQSRHSPHSSNHVDFSHVNYF